MKRRIAYIVLLILLCTCCVSFAETERVPNTEKNAQYAFMLRTTQGNEVWEYYFDAQDRPVALKDGQYGRHVVYENGTASSITYLDAEGAPCMTANGYARIDYILSGGKAVGETYYDAEGMPCARSLGQYGTRYEKDENGRKILIIYLDVQGEPAPTRYGYAILRRTFDEEGRVAQEWYYDENDAPFATQHNSYSRRYTYDDNGTRIYTEYLDRDGRRIFIPIVLLFGNAWLCVIAAVAVLACTKLLPKKALWTLLVLYTLFILYATLFRPGTRDPIPRWYPFESWSRFFRSSLERKQLLYNILLFIPFGSLLWSVRPKKRALLWVILFSACIELTQLCTSLGTCETDDLINNTLGGACGMALAELIRRVRINVKIRETG